VRRALLKTKSHDAEANDRLGDSHDTLAGTTLRSTEQRFGERSSEMEGSSPPDHLA